MPRRSKHEDTPARKRSKNGNTPLYIDTYADTLKDRDEHDLFTTFDVESHKFNDEDIKDMGVPKSALALSVRDMSYDKLMEMEAEMEKRNKENTQNKKGKGGTKKKRRSANRSVKKRRKSKK